MDRARDAGDPQVTLHGDRVTCDVCGRSPQGDAARWVYITSVEHGRLRRVLGKVCPACRARYTNEHLRDMLARKETT